MGLFESAKSVFGQFAVFEGRARRSEYWMFTLFNFLVGGTAIALAMILTAITDSGGVFAVIMLLYGAYTLAALLPGLAVTCRRLHDVNKPGSYMLFYFLPVVGSLLMIVWLIQDGDPGANRYGYDPKSRRAYGSVSSTGEHTGVSTKGDSGSAGEDRKGKTVIKDTDVATVNDCPFCGKRIEKTAMFCNYCGKSVHSFHNVGYDDPPVTTICVNCHAKIDASRRVCPKCGKDPFVIMEKEKKKEKESSGGSEVSGSGSRIKFSKGFSAPKDLD